MKIYPVVVAILLSMVYGCVAVTPPQSINENPLVRIAVVGESGLFAADLEGRRVAVARKGLHLVDLASGVEQQLSTSLPIALAWKRNGLTLSAAFAAADYETRIALYSAQGELVHETLLPVEFSHMLWSERGDLLITGFALKKYSFGGNLQQRLYQVSKQQIVETVLADTTLKPSTVKRLSPLLKSLQPIAFSSHGDVLVFAHLHDPPEFAPYFELRHQNWQIAKSLSLGDFPLQSLIFDWGNSDDSVVVRTSSDEQLLKLWPMADVESDQPFGPYRIVEGRLYDGAELLIDWGEDAHPQVLSDGRFLLAVDGSLYLGDGLRAVYQNKYNEKRWTIRRWLYEGLITHDEYQKLLLGEAR